MGFCCCWSFPAASSMVIQGMEVTVGAEPLQAAVYWGLRALSSSEAAPATIRDIRLWTFILLLLNEFKCEKLSLRSRGQADRSMPGNYWTALPKSRTSGTLFLW